jgi:hypothetical protein
MFFNLRSVGGIALSLLLAISSVVAQDNVTPDTVVESSNIFSPSLRPREAKFSMQVLIIDIRECLIV